MPRVRSNCWTGEIASSLSSNSYPRGAGPDKVSLPQAVATIESNHPGEPVLSATRGSDTIEVRTKRSAYAVGASTGVEIGRVTDNGPGIPAEFTPHLFERFTRGDVARTRTEGSTGLGLSIVHAVVTAHHGTVSVESEPGNTRFTVRLPIEPRGRLASPEAAGA